MVFTGLLVFSGCRKGKFTWNGLNRLGVKATTVMSLSSKRSYLHFEKKAMVVLSQTHHPYFNKKFKNIHAQKFVKIIYIFLFTSIKEMFSIMKIVSQNIGRQIKCKSFNDIVMQYTTSTLIQLWLSSFFIYLFFLSIIRKSYQTCR